MYHDSPFQAQQAHAPFSEQAQLAPVSDPAMYRPPAQPSVGDTAREDHALRRLLGQDLDVYVEGHTEAYEQAKKKWTECTTEEWKAGADGIIISSQPPVYVALVSYSP